VALAVGQYHLVRADQREAWESYTTTSRGWVSQQDLHIQEQQQQSTSGSSSTTAVLLLSSSSLLDPSTALVGIIHDNNGTRVPDEPSFFLPQWQSFPVLTVPRMTDTPLSPAPPVYNMDGRLSVMVGQILEQALPELLVGKVVSSAIRNLVPPITKQQLSMDHQVVGIFAVMIQWRRFLLDILPPKLLL
jgi:xanthosine utilization system XapX-like protein